MASTGCLSWLLFMVVHELGHCIGAWASGAEVERVVLGPLVISETVLGENPDPLLVAWAGPLLGVLLPLELWCLLELAGCSRAYLARFFAGFCLVANGAYIAADAVYQGGDGFVMTLYGTPPLLMVLFGLVTVPPGLLLWHGLGTRFGLGEGRGRVERLDAALVTVALSVVVALELALFPAA